MRITPRLRLAGNRLIIRGFRTTMRRGEIPEGRAFFALSWVLERQCAAETDIALPRSGEKAPRCYSQLGTVLSLLDRLSSCWWGCRGGDHLPEYLVGRALGDLRSAVRLFRFGYYDQSLSLTRNAGEVVNLLQLFSSDPSAFADWKALPSRERWVRYRPKAVRTRLAASGTVLITEERYSRLSEIGAHVNPGTRPQAHNPFGVPNQAPTFQLPGLLVALNEAALVAACLTVPATALIDQRPERRREILSAGRALVEQLGGANVLEVDTWYEEVRSAMAAANPGALP